MKTSVRVHRLQAFTNGAEGGSPTAVVLEADHLQEDQMASLARDMDASHTAFMFRWETRQPLLRFFTRAGLLRHCAHATIAAHALRAMELNRQQEALMQETADGLQEVSVSREGRAWRVYFSQAPTQFRPLAPEAADRLLQILGMLPGMHDRTWPAVLASPGNFRVLLALEENAVDRIQPDLGALNAWCATNDAIGCFAFSLRRQENIYLGRARMFAPRIGVDEDIVNGNSCGCLAAYLARLEPSEDARVRLRMLQGHLFRQAGIVHAFAEKIKGNIATQLGGTAVLRDYFDYHF